jgi:hypothetical protein
MSPRICDVRHKINYRLAMPGEGAFIMQCLDGMLYMLNPGPLNISQVNTKKHIYNM